MNPIRRGGVLIVVAGLSSIVATLMLAFLTRMRSDAEESRLFLQDVQARTMLTAALQYVTETARLGWGDEAFGWVDIRDGRPGPRLRDGRRAPGFVADALGNGAAFPAGGGAARCEMHVWTRPPFAIKPVLVPNPIAGDPATSWADLVSYANPDPQPVHADWERFRSADARPLPASTGLAWFRVLRNPIAPPPDGNPAVFTITCGAGATRGFRDWDEVVAHGAADSFAGGRPEFDALRAQERLLFYEAEWNPAISRNLMFVALPMELSWQNQNRIGPWKSWADQHGGTFLYIQRLDPPPARW